MSVHKTATQPGSAKSVEAALLARLGLPTDASPQEVETAHEELIGFLEAAPIELRTWAAREIDTIDEAYALLSDPTIDRSALTDDAIVATARTAGPAATRPEPIAPVDPAPRSSRVRRAALIAASLVGIVVIAVIGYNMGGGPGAPAVASDQDPVVAAASPAVDMTRVAELMQKIQADPKDTVSLQALADIYFLANEFETAGGFLEKILSIDSQDLTARLALGAVLFNIGQPDDAEDHWRQVLAIDPDNLEAHYDLGFLYLSREPADLELAKSEWARVVEIAPDSEIAKSVQQHLATFDVAPAPSAGASPEGASPETTAGAPAGPSTSPVPSGE